MWYECYDVEGWTALVKIGIIEPTDHSDLAVNSDPD